MAKNPLNSKNSKEILWENCQKIMKHHYGEVHITRFGRETKIKNGGATRIQGMKNVGLDILDRVASCFGLMPWQLLTPNFNPKDLPEIMTEGKREAYKKMQEAIDALKGSP